MKSNSACGTDQERTEKRLAERSGAELKCGNAILRYPDFQLPTVQCSLPARCLAACLPVCLLARRERAPRCGSRQGGRSASPPPPPPAPKILSGPRELKEATPRWSSPRTVSQGGSADFPQLQMNIKVDEIGFYDVYEWKKLPNFGTQGRKKDSISSM